MPDLRQFRDRFSLETQQQDQLFALVFQCGVESRFDMPHTFAQQALDAVAVDGPGEMLFGDGEGELGGITGVQLRIMIKDPEIGVLYKRLTPEELFDQFTAFQAFVTVERKSGMARINDYLPVLWSEMLSLFLPFLRRALRTALPPFVFMRSRKPCLFFFLRTEGWNVRFIAYFFCWFVKIGLQR